MTRERNETRVQGDELSLERHRSHREADPPASVPKKVGSQRAGSVVVRSDWGPDPYTQRSQPPPRPHRNNVRISRVGRPMCFTPKLMGPILLGRLSARRVALDRR